VRNRAAGGASPPAAGDRGDRRNRRDAEAAAVEDARTAPRTDEPAGRRRRTVNLSGDGEKRRVREDGDAPRPSGNAAAVASAAPATTLRTAPRTGESSREAADPLSRLRPYLFSGLGSESAFTEAAKTRPAKSRKRQNKEAAQAPPDATLPRKSVADAPAATVADAPAKTVADAPAKTSGDGAPPAPPPGATAAAAPVEATGTPAMPALAPPPAPSPSAVVTPPRLGQ
jgi:hypothetical protein